MSFRFFRPWEDGGQGNTRKAPDPRHEALTEASKTTSPPPVPSGQAEQRGVPSEEATRFAQVLQDISRPLCKAEQVHRTERKDVGNASKLVAPSMENLRVSHITVLRQTSASDSLEDANSKGKDLDCNDKEAASCSGQRDKHSLEVHKTSSSIKSNYLAPTTALQNDSIEVMSADAFLNFGNISYCLNSLAHSSSLVAENHFNAEAALGVSADITKGMLEMNQSKIFDYLPITKQEGQSPSPSLKEESCAETFSDASSAERQEHRQPGSKPFQSKTSRSANMRQYERTQAESRHFQCTVCGKTFSFLNSLQRHKRIHAGSKPFKCSVCQKSFRQSSNLRLHERIHTGSQPFKCSVCQKAFKQSGSLHVHERIHTGSKPFKYSVCQKTFKQSSNLHAHERIHSGSKPFKCSVCQKAFTRSDHLHVHARIHTGSQPFKCSVYQKAFGQSSSLHVHERIHTGSKPFKCSVCQKAFKQSSNLHAHERIHSGSKPFKCSVCQKAFTRSDHLHVHARIHTGSQPFKCSVCQKAFGQSSSLHAHERIHSESKPFKYSVCQKIFRQSSTLCAHGLIHK